MITSPIVGKTMGRLGRRRVLMYGLVLYGISMVGFVLTSYIESPTLFIILGYVFRFLQGIANKLLL